MTDMSENMRNKAEELRGKSKEKVADWTDDESMQAEGMAEQAKGKGKQSAKDMGDGARDALDDDDDLIE
jgi:uncharacterized protein YjbJ (UPF0337 family)